MVERTNWARSQAGAKAKQSIRLPLTACCQVNHELKVDTLEFLPNYLQCLRNRGWQTELITSDPDEMALKCGRILQRAWNERCAKNPALQPMELTECVKLAGVPQGGCFVTGVVLVPPNLFPTQLLEYTSQANRSQVRLVDATHMRAQGNEGTLYCAFRVDPNRTHQGMAYALLADVENTAGWVVTQRAIEKYEPSTLDQAGTQVVAPPGGRGEPTPSRLVYIGDGDKGIATVFGDALVRCCLHRKANFLTKFKKALQFAEAYSKCHRSANRRDFLRHWHQLSATQQQWATDTASMDSWAQHCHRKHVSAHHAHCWVMAIVA